MQIDSLNLWILQAEISDGSCQSFDQMVTCAFCELDDFLDEHAVINGFFEIVGRGGFIQVEEKFNCNFDESSSCSFFWVASEDA